MTTFLEASILGAQVFTRSPAGGGGRAARVICPTRITSEATMQRARHLARALTTIPETVVNSLGNLECQKLGGLLVGLWSEEVVDEARLLPLNHLLADLVPRPAPIGLPRHLLNIQTHASYFGQLLID